jgi:hypothetical protein
MTADRWTLRDLLELASDDVVEVDLAGRAWHGAAAQRHTLRRRALLGAGGLLAAGAFATVVLRRGDVTSAPGPTPTPSLGGRLDERSVGSVRVSMAPSPATEPRLPRYPDAELLALPELLGTGEARPRALLSPDGVAGTAASVRAVFLVHAGQGLSHPVVLVPRGSPPHLLVPGMLLEPVDDGTGVRTAPRLGPRTIHDDRHRVVVAQPRRVLVLDVRDASVLDLPVPDDGLVDAGWAKDGRTVVARSPERDWLVDTQTHQVRRPEGPARPDYEDLVTGPQGGTVLRSFAGSGTLSDTRLVPDTVVEPYGASTANTESWVASGVLLGDDLERATGRAQGLLAVQDDLSLHARVLAAPEDPHLVRGAYRPLAWGPRDVLVLESRSTSDGGPPRGRLLAWDVIGARLWRVGEVEAPDDSEGGFTGRFAI